MRFFNFPLLIFLLSLGFADEQKTLTSRDYKKLFSQRFNTINKPIISDDEGKTFFVILRSQVVTYNMCGILVIKITRFWTIWWRLGGLWRQWWWRRVWYLRTRSCCAKSDTWNTKRSKILTANIAQTKAYTETHAKTSASVSPWEFCSISILIGQFPCNLNSLILIQIVVEPL